MDEKLLRKVIPHLTDEMISKLEAMTPLYVDWNEKVNLISRKDMDNFGERHLLHSLALAHYLKPHPGSRVVDIGTGGGFPGIPLAIVFPEVNFVLIDSIAKKIKVVDAVAAELKLANVVTFTGRLEQWPGKADYAVSRAVAPISDLVRWGRNKIRPGKDFGFWMLKGGDLKEEISDFKKAFRGKCDTFHLQTIVTSEFFETKKALHAWI